MVQCKKNELTQKPLTSKCAANSKLFFPSTKKTIKILQPHISASSWCPCVCRYYFLLLSFSKMNHKKPSTTYSWRAEPSSSPRSIRASAFCLPQRRLSTATPGTAICHWLKRRVNDDDDGHNILANSPISSTVVCRFP